jgi:excisionase family DNA binding protein
MGDVRVTDIELMTADEVAAMLSLDRKTVYAAAKNGEIPCRKIGRRVLFCRQAIDAWLRDPAFSVSAAIEREIDRRVAAAIDATHDERPAPSPAWRRPGR